MRINLLERWINLLKFAREVDHICSRGGSICSEVDQFAREVDQFAQRWINLLEWWINTQYADQFASAGKPWSSPSNFKVVYLFN